MISHRLVFAAALLAATGAQAAPSCRDSKGAFTPCTPHQARQSAGRTKAQEARQPEPRSHAVDTAAPSSHAKKPAVIARSHLCRDSKGLFTPCPR